MIAPKDESHQLVMQWLENEGLKSQVSISVRGDSIMVEATLSQIEKLLNADYSAFGKFPKISISKLLLVCCLTCNSTI